MIRIFNEKKYYEYEFKKQDVSKYFPDPMCWGLENINIKNNQYILCPVYGNAKGWSDFQIGVTGALGDGETSKIGMSRELKEELGIFPIKCSNLIKSWSGIDKRGKMWDIYSINLKNTDNVVRSLQINVNDSKVNKVGCIVYGTKFETEMYMNSKITLYKSDDNIIGVAAIPAKILRDYIGCKLY
mgnify:CR=1 FL=1|jgi:hypothetical protein